MKFLVDANVRSSVGQHLRSCGHNVRDIAGTPDRSIPDSAVLRIAEQEQRILITNDKDFGVLIFREHRLHSGVILFRITEETNEGYLSRLRTLLAAHSERLHHSYIVITDAHIRIRDVSKR